MEGIEALMRHIYIFPVIGAVLGLIFALTARILAEFAPQGVVTVLVLVVIYKICGINHADGLADFVQGSRFLKENAAFGEMPAYR